MIRGFILTIFAIIVICYSIKTFYKDGKKIKEYDIDFLENGHAMTTRVNAISKIEAEKLFRNEHPKAKITFIDIIM